MHPTLHPFWQACVADFQQELSQHQFNTWIKPLRFEQDGDGFTLVAPNRFIMQWVKDKLLSQIERSGEKFFARPIQLALALEEAEELALPSSEKEKTKAAPNAVPEEAPVNGAIRTHVKTAHRLNPAFIFSNFVGGKANQLARAAAIQVAQNPGSAYNQLFVYGATGLGKTHLVQAIGNTVLEHNPQAHIRYIHAEQFVTAVVQAYQHKSFDSFKRGYHSLDLLLIDDIQFLGGKSRTQEEFFYTFNALIEAGKQVVITSDRYPKEISGIEERLISRFGWGLTVSVEPPELEMRVAILLKKAESEGVVLAEEVAFFIAKHIRSNVRELEGALKRVLAFSRFNNTAISVTSAKEALKDLLAVLNRKICNSKA